MSVSPAARGYAMPAEWAPHRATWLAWPHNRMDWPGKFSPIPWAYGEIVRHLAPRERVGILVQDAAVERRARNVLERVGMDLSRIDFLHVPTDRCWTRDSGPIFVRNSSGKRLATEWVFNGWAKYPNHKRDRRVAGKIAQAVGVPVCRIENADRPVVLEGGAIDVDGAGTLLATEECLLSDVQARNPGLGRQGIERILGDALGIRRVLWLDRGIAGDDTHGHIDDVARFTAPGRILLCIERNPKEENYVPLQENRERLQGARDARGRKIEVVPLPLPTPIVFDGMRVPASYANFYIANGAVLVPTFNDPKDRLALGLLAELFPAREVVGIHCGDFIWGLGTIHCATQQEPA